MAYDYSWTDDPLNDYTTVKTTHVNELKNYISQRLSGLGLTSVHSSDCSSFYSNAIKKGDVIYAWHLKYMKDDIQQIADHLGISISWNTDYDNLQYDDIETNAVGSGTQGVGSGTAIQIEELRRNLERVGGTCTCDGDCGCNQDCGCDGDCGCNNQGSGGSSCGCNTDCGCDGDCGSDTSGYCNINCGCHDDCGCNQDCGCNGDCGCHGYCSCDGDSACK